MAEVVLIGGGGHAAVLVDVLERLGHRVLGFSAPDAASARVDVPFLGSDEDLLRRFAASDVVAVLGLGKTDIGGRRLQLLAALAGAGLRFPAIVAPAATVHARATLGDATVVLDGAVVATGSRLGRACIVNTNATVDHDCVLGDDVHVAPGATVSGDVSIGAGSMIGAGATVVQGVRVGAGILVGAGATVVADLEEPGTYVGTPARRLR
jgi:sugar O-acyltransferase (sialic acid O-acetyltransferase NeuD family)